MHDNESEEIEGIEQHAGLSEDLKVAKEVVIIWPINVQTCSIY